MQKIHVFTSVTNNYIPKARVLAESVKKFHPDFTFHLVLSDRPITDTDCIKGNFIDSIIFLEELPIPNLKGWIFQHDIVELCTAVKGIAFIEIQKRYQCEKIIYLDPDTVLFNNLDEIIDILDNHSVVLTPHFSKPQETNESILHYEISCLKHGIFNLGFLAVNISEESEKFLNWWAYRLLNFCYDEIVRGLFTDQRWIDFAPVFFPNIYILRKPNYNVAIWNLLQYPIRGNLEEGLLIDNLPLIFYHFTGFDNNVDIAMLKKYNLSKVVSELRKWYANKIEEMEQKNYGSIPCIYSKYENQVKITNLQRVIYRNNAKIQILYPNPFITSDNNKSFYNWCITHEEQLNDSKLLSYEYLSAIPVDSLISLLQSKIVELEAFKLSKFWKLRKIYWKIKKIWS